MGKIYRYFIVKCTTVLITPPSPNPRPEELKPNLPPVLLEIIFTYVGLLLR